MDYAFLDALPNSFLHAFLDPLLHAFLDPLLHAFLDPLLQADFLPVLDVLFIQIHMHPLRFAQYAIVCIDFKNCSETFQANFFFYAIIEQEV